MNLCSSADWCLVFGLESLDPVMLGFISGHYPPRKIGILLPLFLSRRILKMLSFVS